MYWDARSSMAGAAHKGETKKARAAMAEKKRTISTGVIGRTEG